MKFMGKGFWMTLTLVLAVAGEVAAADHVHGATTGPGDSDSVSVRHRIPLADQLKEWERVYNVSFFYENSLVKNKMVDRDRQFPSLDQALSETLAPLHLTYSKLKNAFYVIKSDPPPPPVPRTAAVTDATMTAAAEIVSVPAGETVKGIVSDNNGKPVTGATVSLTGPAVSKTVSTDEKGGFSFRDIPAGDYVLSFTHVGYDNYSKPLVVGNAELVMNISLEPSVSALKDVVVVGYGTQKKKDITGAIAVVSSAALEDRPNTEFGYQLEGKAAGVQVIRSSGQPQSGFSIRIRGTSTITSGSEPLYLVDGVPTQSINEINPADIESFSILKDASAAAIYGASGANGVVLITTRRGRNQPTVTRLDVYQGRSTVWKHKQALNSTQYKSLMEEMGQSLDWSQYNANTDWQHELFRNGAQQNYQLSVTGGNEKTGFYLSGAWTKNDGVVISNTLNRANFKLNVDHRISKLFKVGTSVSYNRWYDIDVSENSRNGSIMNTILGSPVIGVWDSTHSKYTTDPFRNDLDNPVGLASGSPHNFTNTRFNGNVYVEANILPVLKFRSMFGYEKFNGTFNSYTDPYKTTSGRGFNGSAELSQNENQYWISENTLTFNKSFGKHTVSAMGGFIASRADAMGSDIRTHNFANPNVTTVNGGSVLDGATGSASTITTSSFISRVTYDYAGRYLLTGNLRSDASSVFGPDKRWGTFPSFSAGWRISKESFFENVKAVNELKLRGSWGVVGNSQIPAYSYLGTVSPSGSYVIGDHVVAGYLPNNLDNPTLHWETTRQTDIGLDVEFLQSRIALTADYYYKKTTGLLLNTPVPASSGYTTALKNIGDLENKGLEFTLTTKNTTGKLVWTSDFNISFNRNKVLNIADGVIYDGPIDERGNSSIAKAGLALGTFYGYVARGVDPKTGNINYKMADTSEGLQPTDQQVIGHANPQFAYGFTNNFRYGHWALMIFIQGVQGNDILNATRIFTQGMWEPRNQDVAVLRRWTTPGQITDVPREDMTNYDAPLANYNSLISSRYVENGSYLRLKSVSLSYELTSGFVTRWKMSRVKLYLTAENLLTFTKYSGFDPEVSAFGSGSNTAPGVDFGTYPQTRDFIAGLSVSF